MNKPLLLFPACLIALGLSSCSKPYDETAVFAQAKSDCYRQNNGLCDADIQTLRDHGDTEDAGIADGYRTAGK